jgi:hypothetical protein
VVLAFREAEALEREFQRVIDPVERVETGIGVLEHRLHLLAEGQLILRPDAVDVLPLEQDLPVEGGLKPSIRLPIVDLPDPDCPTMEMILGTSPSSLKLIGCSAVTSPYLLADVLQFQKRRAVLGGEALGQAAAVR